MMAEENHPMQRWTHLPVAYTLMQAHPQQYEIAATSDLGNIYVQIMEACHPFYQLSEKYDSATFKIPPRLEDGLGITSQTSAEGGNPQDGAS
jgi:ribosomal protein L31